MARVRGRDTGPEMLVRRLVHRMGYRFRLHGRGLPGRPDLVFRSSSKVIFVHGCFWHRHKDCALARVPKSRLEFWEPKLEGNRLRDENNVRALKASGWHVLTIWECELSSPEKLAKRVRRFLDAKR
jgi:DNA mismatch endonuclease, patch repair protein